MVLRFKMKSQQSTTIALIFATMILSTALAEKKAIHPNSTTEVSEAMETRKLLSKISGSRGLLSGLSGALGGSSSATGAQSGGGGGGGLQALQQGLKGIQSVQKFFSSLSSVVRLPFSFRGVSDTMATLTGLLAAVGGGYLTYVSMVGLFGNLLDPQGQYANEAYFGPAQAEAQNHAHVYAQAPPGYGPVHQGAGNHQAQHQGPYRRQSNGGLHFGSMDLSKMYQSVVNFNYPEASFKLLRIKDEVCKHRAVCELEKFLAKKGVASVILKGVSKKITGMEKYLDAAYRGLSNEECSFAYASCPFTLGQTLIRSVGLN